MAGYIHWTVCKRVGLHVTDRYHGHIPERVINVSGTTIMWDILVITNQTLLANQPHTVLHDKKREDLPVHIRTAEELECLALPTLHMPLVLVYRLSLTPFCDLNNDQITGGREMVTVGPKLSIFSRDLDYWVWMTKKLLYMFSVLP